MNTKNCFLKKTKIVAVTHISNSLGTINPVKELLHWRMKKVFLYWIDGAQAIHHTTVDVKELIVILRILCTKMYGPTGIGVLYGKEELLNAIPPYQGGGDMIKTVTFTKKQLQRVALINLKQAHPTLQANAFGAAIYYINSLGIENIAAYKT